jgi:hypothetical protein
MALAKLLQQCVLLQEGTGGAAARVAEDKARLVQHSYLIMPMQLATLIAADYRFVDKGAVTGQILEDCNGVASPVLSEEQAMSVRDDRVIHNDIFCIYQSVALGTAENACTITEA